MVGERPHRRIDDPRERGCDAYGGQATAAGTVKTGAPLALDLRGTASNIDLRNLPEALQCPGSARATFVSRTR